NIIVSQVRRDLLGKPFGMYDFAPVGLSLTVLGVLFLAVGYRLLSTRRTPLAALHETLEAKPYVTQVEAPEDWTADKRRVVELTALGEGAVKVVALIRGGSRRANPHGSTVVRNGDKLLLEGEQAELERFIARA